MGDVGGRFAPVSASSFQPDALAGTRLLTPAGSTVASTLTASQLGMPGATRWTIFLQYRHPLAAASLSTLFSFGNAGGNDQVELAIWSGAGNTYGDLIFVSWSASVLVSPVPSGGGGGDRLVRVVCTYDGTTLWVRYGAFDQGTQTWSYGSGSTATTLSLADTTPLRLGVRVGGGGATHDTELAYLGIVGGLAWNEAECDGFLRRPEALWTSPSLLLRSAVAGGADALTAAALAAGAPVLGTPALGQAHALAATALAAGAPVLGAPALGQLHALTASALGAGAPVLGAPALGQAHALTAAALAAGAPVLGTPALGQAHALAAAALAAGAPVLGAPSLGQVHALAATALAAGAPVLGTPILSSGAADNLGAADLAAGAPVLGTPALGQAHALAAAALAAGAPVLGAPALGQVHALAASALAAGAPVLGTPGLSSGNVDALGAVGIAAGAPVLGVPALGTLPRVGTLEQALFLRLTADAGVAALVGQAVYPVRAPQGAPLPRIVFARQDTENLGHLRGRGTHDRVRVNVSAFAADNQAARALADAAHRALQGWRGGGVVQGSRVIGRVQGVLPEPQADPGIRRDSILVTFLAAET